MKTSDCKRADATAAPPDPRKHVNYIQGMVLGVDDLIQEFAYHRNQRQWLARDAIGYGTLSGLRVTFRNDLKVSVAPGTALSPRGQLIRVTPEQCAGINDWLDLADTQEKIKSLGSAFNVYAVLCFRDCQVDELPVPGEPCRCEDQAMAPSRILDDFRLELRLTPPAQREEDAVRDFVQWLRQIKVSEAAAGSSLDDFLIAIHNAVQDRSSPLESPPDFLYGSPPENVIIPAPQLCEYLRAALKLWVVELRPLWQAQWAQRVGGGCGCHGDEQAKGHDAEECLLLAALTVTLTGGRVANENDVVVDDSRRPFVVPLRMLQEMLLCGPCCGGGGGCNERTFATVFALDDHTLRIWIHHPLPVTFGSDAVQVEIDDNPMTGFTIAQAASDGSAPGGPNVFDLDFGASPPEQLQHHQQITLKLDTRLMVESTSPSQTLAEAISLNGLCYPDLADAIAHVFGVAQLPALDDLADVNSAPAQEGNVLTRQGGQWVASAPPAGGGGATDHGVLTGLGDDDHPQYHNDTRGDARYAPLNHSHDHGSLTGLSDDDHPQYLLADGTRALTGDLSAGNHKLTNLAAATINGDAVRFEQAVKNGDPAGGDLRGTFPDPIVRALQGRAVVDNAPTAGDLLTWNAAGAGQWEPRSAPSPGVTIEQVAEELPTLPFVTITRGPQIGNAASFDLWFHLNAGPTFTRANLPELTTFPDSAVAIFAETDQPAPPASPFLARRAIERVTRIDRNIFRVQMAGNQVEKDLLLRFIFAAGDLGLRREPGAPEISVGMWIGQRPVKWVGHDGAKTITTFFRNETDGAASGYVAVAAGRFRRDGAPIGRVLGGASATPHPQFNSAFLIQFTGYDPQNSYVVTGTPVLKIPSEDNPFVVVAGDSLTPNGIPVWLRPDVPSGGFLIQVHQIL